MANHGVSPQSNVKFLSPGQEGLLRVEDGTELIYLEEGAELKTHVIDGVEYLFVDENQQVVDPREATGEGIADHYFRENQNGENSEQMQEIEPDTGQGTVEYITEESGSNIAYLEDGTCIQYIQENENEEVSNEGDIKYVEDDTYVQYIDEKDNVVYEVDEAMQYINTGTNTHVQNTDTPHYIEYVESSDVENTVIEGSGINYTEVLDTVNPTANPLDYIDAPVLEPEPLIDSGNIEVHQDSQPPTLNAEVNLGDVEQDSGTQNVVQAPAGVAPEPIYVQHEGIVYQINDPELMTPQALEDIKETLLENSFGNDAKREITTHQHSQSTAAEEVLFTNQPGVEYVEYTPTKSPAAVRTNTSQVYSLVNNTVQPSHLNSFPNLLPQLHPHATQSLLLQQKQIQQQQQQIQQQQQSRHILPSSTSVQSKRQHDSDQLVVSLLTGKCSKSTGYNSSRQNLSFNNSKQKSGAYHVTYPTAKQKAVEQALSRSQQLQHSYGQQTNTAVSKNQGINRQQQGNVVNHYNKTQGVNVRTQNQIATSGKVNNIGYTSSARKHIQDSLLKRESSSGGRLSGDKTEFTPRLNGIIDRLAKNDLRAYSSGKHNASVASTHHLSSTSVVKINQESKALAEKQKGLPAGARLNGMSVKRLNPSVSAQSMVSPREVAGKTPDAFPVRINGVGSNISLKDLVKSSAPLTLRIKSDGECLKLKTGEIVLTSQTKQANTNLFSVTPINKHENNALSVKILSPTKNEVVPGTFYKDRKNGSIEKYSEKNRELNKSINSRLSLDSYLKTIVIAPPKGFHSEGNNNMIKWLAEEEEERSMSPITPVYIGGSSGLTTGTLPRSNSQSKLNSSNSCGSIYHISTNCSDFMCQVNMDAIGKPKILKSNKECENTRISETQITYGHTTHRGTQTIKTGFICREVLNNSEVKSKSGGSDIVTFDMECEDIQEDSSIMKNSQNKDARTLIGRTTSETSPGKTNVSGETNKINTFSDAYKAFVNSSTEDEVKQETQTPRKSSLTSPTSYNHNSSSSCKKSPFRSPKTMRTILMNSSERKKKPRRNTTVQSPACKFVDSVHNEVKPILFYSKSGKKDSSSSLPADVSSSCNVTFKNDVDDANESEHQETGTLPKSVTTSTPVKEESSIAVADTEIKIEPTESEIKFDLTESEIKIERTESTKLLEMLTSPNFNVGEDCKAKHSDGNVYDGIITQVDTVSARCYVDFLDKGCAWCEFSAVQGLAEPEEEITVADSSDEENDDPWYDHDVYCVTCLGGNSTRNNEIVICDGCGQGYHQQCHRPYIRNTVIENFDLEWVCSTCRPPYTQNCKYVPPLPYEMRLLTWNTSHTENSEKKYCYCGENGTWFMQMLQCRKCKQWFHQDCVSGLEEALILGDLFYVFVCKRCNRGEEFLHRLQLRWVDVVQLAIFHIGLAIGRNFLDLESNVLPWLNRTCLQLKIPNWVNCNVDRRIVKLQEALTDLHCGRRFRCKRDYKKSTVLWGLRIKAPPGAPIVKLPLMFPMTTHNTAAYKWKPVYKHTHEPCDIIKWTFAQPLQLKLQKKRKLSGSSDTDVTDNSKKRKLDEKNYEKTGKPIKRRKKKPPPPQPRNLLEKLIPLKSDYSGTNNPFLLEVEAGDLEKRGLWKARLVEKNEGITLRTVTDQARASAGVVDGAEETASDGDGEESDEDSGGGRRVVRDVPYCLAARRTMYYNDEAEDAGDWGEHEEERTNYLIDWTYPVYT